MNGQDAAGEPDDLAGLQERMEEIKRTVADEVDRSWQSQWRSEEMFAVKVSARLSAHEEYQSLLERARRQQQDAASGERSDDAGTR